MVHNFLLNSHFESITQIEQIISSTWLFWFSEGKIFTLQEKPFYRSPLDTSTQPSSQSYSEITSNSPPFILNWDEFQQQTGVIPFFREKLGNEIEGFLFGTYQMHPCIVLFSKFIPPNSDLLTQSFTDLDPNELKGSFVSLRNYFGKVPIDLILIAGVASQLTQWLINSQYCGRCGNHLIPSKKELALDCSSCNLLLFPQISPAIIVAVSKGDSLLLAHNRTFPEELYSIIAGFCDPGESAEETIVRELHEEVGIDVKNIQYFGSQPWPFPNSLMLGYTAEWAAGEITVDGEEILDARWFRPDEIPHSPSPVSISGILINDFLERIKKKGSFPLKKINHG